MKTTDKVAKITPINERLIQPTMKVFPIPGFKDYFASPDGHIYSKAKKFGKVPANYMKMTPFINQGGQLVVSLKLKDGAVKIRLARLIALTFLGDPPSPGAKAKLIMPDLPPAANNVTWTDGY